jgi:hypothetical protein
VGENNTELISWYWPADDESILPIVTSIIDTTIVSIVNAQLPVYQTPAGQSESFGAAWRSLMERAVRTPAMLPQL